MARFVDGPEVEVSAEIGAPPEVVWALVTDINLPGRFQDEFLRAEWLESDGPRLGATFQGFNQRGGYQWDTTSWVVACQPEREFGWAVSDPDNPGSVWTYRLEPSAGGTRLNYHRRLGPGPSGISSMIDREPDREEEIITKRDETHRQNMQSVVDGIKALAEQGS